MGFFSMASFQRCQHQKTSSSQNFKETKLCGFFKWNAGVQPQVFCSTLEHQKWQQQKVLVAKPEAALQEKTSPLLHSHCKRKNYLLLSVFFPLISRVYYKNYYLQIANDMIWNFERGNVSGNSIRVVELFLTWFPKLSDTSIAEPASPLPLKNVDVV